MKLAKNVKKKRIFKQKKMYNVTFYQIPTLFKF